MREPERPSAAAWWRTQIKSYEPRYQEWCRVNRLDPEDTGSVLAYEQMYDEDDLPTPYDFNP